MMSEARKLALASPEVRQRISAGLKRAHARRAVQKAGLPLLRKFVDRAAVLYAGGAIGADVVQALIREFRKAA